jgi:multicomponent Na+:H+ antiporter subunit G
MNLLIEIVVWVGLATGSIFALIGGIGLLRLPEFYTRIHAVGVTDTLGAGLVLLSCGIYSGFTLLSVKLFTIWAFIYLTGPAATHALAKAAYAKGLKVQEDPEKGRRSVLPV